MKKRKPRAVQDRAAIAHALSTIQYHVTQRYGTPFGTLNIVPDTVASTEATLLTPQQASKALGVSPKTLANWRVTGTHSLPFVKVGSRVRYRSEDVRAFLINNSKQCTSER